MHRRRCANRLRNNFKADKRLQSANCFTGAYGLGKRTGEDTEMLLHEASVENNKELMTFWADFKTKVDEFKKQTHCRNFSNPFAGASHADEATDEVCGVQARELYARTQP